MAHTTNGSALAATLAAGIGSMAMGAIVLLSEAGVIAAPTLYQPAGAVTGRTAAATAAWLVSWALLHARWKGREVSPRPVYLLFVALTVIGIIGTFPLVWSLF